MSEESQSVREPPSTPPLPADAPEVPRTHHVAPHLLFHPVAHIPEAAARIADGKVSQCATWGDRRHLKPLAWMMVGLMQASVVSLTAWAPYGHHRALDAQSLVRRFDRWLQNQRIEVHQVYGPLIQNVLAEWGTHALYLALDPSTLWERYGLVRMCLLSGTSDAHRVDGAATSEQSCRLCRLC